MNKNYIKNNQVKFRENNKNYIIYNLQTRILINLSIELFEFWKNIENIEKYLEEKKISNTSVDNIIETLLFYNLIKEEKRR
jgi:hypothetical protein